MGESVNLFGWAALAAVQIWITVAVFRATWRAAWPVRLAVRAVVALFGVAVVACYSFTLSHFTARMKLAGPVPTVLGAIALMYAMAATAVAAIHLVLIPLRRHFRADVNPGRRRVLNAAGSALMASPFMAIGYGSLVQRTSFRVREIDMPVPGLSGDLDGLRILQLSDIHLSPFLSESELARVIDASIELRPNLAVMTGDLISTKGDPLDACIRQLARIKTDMGIFACMGNHERYASAEDYAERAGAAAGIRFLRRRSAALRVGRSVLNVAGVDYQALAGSESYLKGAERMIVPGACNVLLSHNPDVFEAAARQGWNVLFGGHTHGGQVTVEILDQSINPARFFTPYVYGLYRHGSSSAYVTRGIGTIGIPARIGAPPEISVIRLRKA